MLNNEVQHITASQKAYEIIRNRILDGTLKPGIRLSKRKMAALTGVSVIPVIEALHLIENDGLAHSKSQWGSFVTIPTRREVLNRFALREAVECQAARILAGKLDTDDAERLGRLAQKLDASNYSAESEQEVWELHHAFHLAIAEATGLSSLVDSLRRCNLFALLVRAVVAHRRRSALPPDWHMRLLDAIASGDADKAEVQMRIHVQNGLNDVLADLHQDSNE